MHIEHTLQARFQLRRLMLYLSYYCCGCFPRLDSFILFFLDLSRGVIDELKDPGKQV